MRLDHMQFPLVKLRGFKRDGLSQLKLFVKPRFSKREDSPTNFTSSPEVESIENSGEGPEPNPGIRTKLVDISDHQKWTLVQSRGTRPFPRFNHAAAVVGRKLLVIGGESGSGVRNDVQMLHLGKLSWSTIGVGDSAPSKGLPIKTGPAQELPKCKGHSLITWGKTVILIGGQVDPPADKLQVWSFDLEMDSWTAVVTKGEIPSSRRGQSVTRAGSILIMFGGEDMKSRKLNDLHILDLKSLMWLPLQPTGRGPSPRARHIAEMYDDRLMMVFGGETKSKISNDIYALDFDAMEWSKLKMKGTPLSPRAGHAGALIGSRWYIVGGESRISGTLDTIAVDFLSMDWSVVVPAVQDVASVLQGLSVSYIERKDRKFLVVFGGCGSRASNAVQVLHIPKEEPPRVTLAGLLELPTTPDLQVSALTSQLVRSDLGSAPSFLGATIPCACVSVAKTRLGDMVDNNSSQRSTSTSVSRYSYDLDRDSGLVPLRMRYAAFQNSQRMEPLAHRPSSQVSNLDTVSKRRFVRESSWDSISSSRRRDLPLPKLRDPPGAIDASDERARQHQIAERIRGEWQSTEFTGPPLDSGLQCAENWQITAQSVHPGSVSSDASIDSGTLLFQTAANLPRRGRSFKGGSESSECSGYAETFVSGNGEEHNVSEPSVNDSTRSLDSNLNVPVGSTAFSVTYNRTTSYCEEDELHRLSNVSRYMEAELNELSTSKDLIHGDASTIPDEEEYDLAALSRLEEADSALERSKAISKIKEHHERKLAAAVRTGELLAGQYADALWNRDEAERLLQNVNQSRELVEGRLAMALKQIEDLQCRLSPTELARDKSDSTIHNVRLEKLKFERDQAVKNAVLGESQKELEATRGILNSEGEKAFQSQVELYDAKHKFRTLNPRAR